MGTLTWKTISRRIDPSDHLAAIEWGCKRAHSPFTAFSFNENNPVRVHQSPSTDSFTIVNMMGREMFDILGILVSSSKNEMNDTAAILLPLYFSILSN